jgi:hypothetical protein
LFDRADADAQKLGDFFVRSALNQTEFADPLIYRIQTGDLVRHPPQLLAGVGGVMRNEVGLGDS